MTAKEFSERDPTDDKIAGYDVDQGLALQVLAVHAPKAAQWFYGQGYPSLDEDWPNFGFKHSEVEVLSTFTEAELQAMGPLVRYDDLETGTMRSMG